MSVVIAEKHNGFVYMGADTQTSDGDFKRNTLNDSSFKVVKMDNNILFAFAGKVLIKQGILSKKDLFTLDENGNLTKKHIVNNIIPKLCDLFENMGEKYDDGYDAVMILAHKDKIYHITSELDVKYVTHYIAIGCGKSYVFYSMQQKANANVEDRILSALRYSASKSSGVSNPFILIDTKEQQYKIVEE